MGFSFYRDKGFTAKLMGIPNCSGSTCYHLHCWEITCICASYHSERKASGYFVVALEKSTFCPCARGNEVTGSSLLTCKWISHVQVRTGIKLVMLQLLIFVFINICTLKWPGAFCPFLQPSSAKLRKADLKFTLMALDFQIIPYSKDSVLLLFSWRDTCALQTSSPSQLIFASLFLIVLGYVMRSVSKST